MRITLSPSCFSLLQTRMARSFIPPSLSLFSCYRCSGAQNSSVFPLFIIGTCWAFLNTSGGWGVGRTRFIRAMGLMLILYPVLSREIIFFVPGFGLNFLGWECLRGKSREQDLFLAVLQHTSRWFTIIHCRTATMNHDGGKKHYSNTTGGTKYIFTLAVHSILLFPCLPLNTIPQFATKSMHESIERELLCNFAFISSAEVCSRHFFCSFDGSF